MLEGPIKEAVEHDTRALREWKEVEVIESGVQPDYIHRTTSISGPHPPCVYPSCVFDSSEAGGENGVPEGRILEGKTGNQDFQELPSTEGEAILGQSLFGTGLLRQ